MRIRVRVPRALSEAAGGRTTFDIDVASDAATIGAVLDGLKVAAPAIDRRLRDEQGRLRRHVNVFIGDANARDAGGLAAPVRDGDEVSVLPAISGG
jgi:molybdopterin converting factor small subunit